MYVCIILQPSLNVNEFELKLNLQVSLTFRVSLGVQREVVWTCVGHNKYRLAQSNIQTTIHLNSEDTYTIEQ